MKTRELLACEARVLGSRLQRLKPKELRRHIDRIAGDLGEPDTDALLARILEATRSPTEAQGAEGEEPWDGVDRVFRAMEGPIEVTEENRLRVLRLMVICQEYLRQALRQRLKELRVAERAKHRHEHHHGGHRCGDPNCETGGEAPRADAFPEPSPLAP